jgi:hypothetical protein
LKALGRRLETFTVRLFLRVGKGACYGCVAAGRGTGFDQPRLWICMVDPKGHQATSPAEMLAMAWKDLLKRTYKRVWDDNVGLVTAGAAFYGFFALLSKRCRKLVRTMAAEKAARAA